MVVRPDGEEIGFEIDPLRKHLLLEGLDDMEAEAALIEQAVANVLASGLRTADIMSPGMAQVGTSVMGEAVVRELGKLNG